MPPPTAPAATPGEYLTATPSGGNEGTNGPIGLGFRVPMLVVSPFSAGGFVCSDTLDLPPTLRLLESRFGTTVPNLTSWRRSVTGDMTTAFNFAAAPNAAAANLPSPSFTDQRVVGQESCRHGADQHGEREQRGDPLPDHGQQLGAPAGAGRREVPQRPGGLLGGVAVAALAIALGRDQLLIGGAQQRLG